MTVEAEPVSTVVGEADREDLDHLYHLDDLDQPLRAQLQELEAMPALARTCWKPYPNNFVWVLVPRAGGGTCQAYRLTRAHALAALNSIDAQLVQWLRSIAETSTSPEQRQTCAAHFAEWQRNDEAGSNLIGVDHAVAMMQILGETHDLPAALRTHRMDLVNAIRQLSATIRCGIRFAVYAPYQIAATVAETVVSELDHHNALSFVSSIEIAKSLDSEGPAHVIRHPAVMVYVEANTIAESPHTLTTVASVAAAVGTSIGVDVAATSATRHAVGIGPSVELAQGFRLLKRYLKPIELLDDLYLRDVNHAIARPRSDPEEAAAKVLYSLVGR